jgi:hypothetical protein
MSEAAQLEDAMKRRTFARFLALTGSIGLLRPDVLATAFDNGAAIDDVFADRLYERSLQYMRQWDQLPPHVLYTVVMGHVDEIQMALNCARPSPLIQRMRVIASETAAFAGMLGWFMQDRALAEVALSVAEDFADVAGHPPVKAVVLAIRADFHSQVQLGRHIGSAITRTMLEAADHAAGLQPSPVRAWVLLRQAEEYAVIGRDVECQQRLDMADTVFAAVRYVPPGMFGHWSQQRHHAFRGSCAQLIGDYSGSLSILSPILQSIEPSAVSNRISLQTDMAAVHARQGEPEEASALLASSLTAATQAGLRERVKRIIGVRTSLLATYEDHPDVRRLDEQVGALTATMPAKRP